MYLNFSYEQNVYRSKKAKNHSVDFTDVLYPVSIPQLFPLFSNSNFQISIPYPTKFNIVLCSKKIWFHYIRLLHNMLSEFSKGKISCCSSFQNGSQALECETRTNPDSQNLIWVLVLPLNTGCLIWKTKIIILNVILLVVYH